MKEKNKGVVSFQQAYLSVCARLDKMLGVLLNVLLCVLVLDVCWQVFSRFFLTQPSSVTEELARYLLIWIGLLGAAHAYRQRMHLGIDLLVVKLKGAQRKAAVFVIHCCCAFFAVSIFILGGGNLMLMTLELHQLSASLNIPMAVVYLSLPISGLMMLMFSVEFLMKDRLDSGAMLSTRTKAGF